VIAPQALFYSELFECLPGQNKWESDPKSLDGTPQDWEDTFAEIMATMLSSGGGT